MKKFIFLQVLLVFISYLGIAQETPAEEPAQQPTEVDKRPVRDMFETGVAFDQITVVGPMKNSMHLLIQHRFGKVENGITDLYGIYATANVRMALTYGITDKISIGAGTTRYYKLQDLHWKVALLQQTRSGNIPVSVSYFGNMSIDARDKKVFGDPAKYTFKHRFSYYNQLMVAKKINQFSVQASVNCAYFNIVYPGFNNLNFSASGLARYKFNDVMGIVASYEQPFSTPSGLDIQPNFAGGFEIGTPTHAFQLFVTNTDYLVNQYNMQLNTNELGDILVGLNVTVRF